MVDFDAVKRALWETALVGGSSLIVLLVFQIILTAVFPLVGTVGGQIGGVSVDMANQITDNTTKDLVVSLTTQPMQASKDLMTSALGFIQIVGLVIAISMLINVISAAFTGKTLGDRIRGSGGSIKDIYEM
jgi:hypothetical protein